MAYFDNAATSFPKPARVRREVAHAFDKYAANPGRSGHKMSMDTARKIYDSRERASRLFGVENPADVVFTLNCTHAINLALKGVLRRGDHVIISDLEHNSVLRPIHAMSLAGIITYSIAIVQDNDDDTLREFESLITPHTKLIACTHGSNAWGIKLPAQRIGALAASGGILFLLDAAQTAGSIDIDVVRDKIDFLCMPGHKGLFGPPGTGMLITPHGSRMGTIVEGGTGSLSALFEQPEDMPERLESGTLNTFGVIGLEKGMEFVMERGPEAIHRHEMEIAAYIFSQLRKNKRVRLYNENFSIQNSLPIVSFNLEGMNSEDVAEHLSSKGFALRAGLHCAPLAHRKMGTDDLGAVRISPGCFNTMEQAEKLIWYIKEMR